MDHRIEVLFLASEGIGIVSRFTRTSPTEEIKGHDLVTSEQRHNTVIQMVVVRESMAEHDGGTAARMNIRRDPVTSAWNPDQLR